MFRIRLHGRGGQGIKTAGRILGTAFFNAGFEVQDAPRYGAERRGAPIFAYVRAAREPIHERGVITAPDLVVVVDESLLPLATAGVTAGITADTVVLINGSAGPEFWRREFAIPGTVLAMPAGEAPPQGSGLPMVAVACAGAAARLVGRIGRAQLEAAVREELSEIGQALLPHNVEQALAAYDAMGAQAHLVHESPPAVTGALPRPDWIEPPNDPVPRAVASILEPGTSVLSQTGLWRTQRPVVDPTKCHKCSWICSTYCPDNAIAAGPDGIAQVDYDHCKGCMICLAECPSHAIEAVWERDAQADAEEAHHGT